jgi:hypothetical protein
MGQRLIDRLVRAGMRFEVTRTESVA